MAGELRTLISTSGGVRVGGRRRCRRRRRGHGHRHRRGRGRGRSRCRFPSTHFGVATTWNRMRRYGGRDDCFLFLSPGLPF